MRFWSIKFQAEVLHIPTNHILLLELIKNVVKYKIGRSLVTNKGYTKFEVEYKSSEGGKCRACLVNGAVKCKDMSGQVVCLHAGEKLVRGIQVRYV